MVLCLRTAGDPKPLIEGVRREISNLDSAVPVTETVTIEQQLNNHISQERLIATLSSFFGFLALLLAAIGIYGVVGFLVAQQTREIGVRMALGATPKEILKMVLSRVARWTIAGTVAGVLGAWFCARLLESLLFGVKPGDGVTFLAMTLVLVFRPYGLLGTAGRE